MRLKNRYLLLELRWKDGKVDASMQESAIQTAIRDSIGVNFGDHGVALCTGALQVKYHNPLTGMCMLRCARDQLQEVSCQLLRSRMHQLEQYRWMTEDLFPGRCVMNLIQCCFVQVLASIACISSIKYRTVLIKMVHNGGTLASCQRAAIAHDKAALQQMKLSGAQTRVASEAGIKLQALGL